MAAMGACFLLLLPVSLALGYLEYGDGCNGFCTISGKDGSQCSLYTAQVHATTFDGVVDTRPAKCDAGAEHSSANCPDGGTVPCGYDSYTSAAAFVACSGEWARHLFSKVGETPIRARNLWMNLELIGMETIAGRPGEWMTFKVTGGQTDGPNGSEEWFGRVVAACEMKSGVQMYICQDCNCPKTIEFNQFNQMIAPQQQSKSKCGLFFVGATTAMQMIYASFRSYTLENHPVLSQCISTDRPDPNSPTPPSPPPTCAVEEALAKQARS